MQEGTIPTAINLPFTTKGFDELAAKKLPADKAKPLIFFCQGITCMLSPNSLRRAEAMGYTNVKVYREGWPEWTQKNVGVLAAAHLQGSLDRQGHPARPASTRAPAGEVQAGFIKGAVAIGPAKVKAALARFPDKKLKAPFMVYDADNGKAAMDVAIGHHQGRLPQRHRDHRWLQRLEGGGLRRRHGRAGHQGRVRAQAASRATSAWKPSGSSRSIRLPTR